MCVSRPVLQMVLYQSAADKNTHTHTCTGDGGTAGGPITDATHSYSPQQDHRLPLSLLPLQFCHVGLITKPCALFAALGASQQVWRTYNHFYRCTLLFLFFLSRKGAAGLKMSAYLTLNTKNEYILNTILSMAALWHRLSRCQSLWCQAVSNQSFRWTWTTGWCIKKEAPPSPPKHSCFG